MGSAQRRIGPFNLGWYGILSSIINGCNLIITQLIIPKLHFYFGFQLFPIFFFLFSIISYSIIAEFTNIVLNDIKSIIAPSTISQISYMFIALLINPILCFYHIIIHSLFKSILFLLAGSLIHIQYNYQNIYQIKMNYKFYWITHLLTSNILITSIYL